MNRIRVIVTLPHYIAIYVFQLHALLSCIDWNDIEYLFVYVRVGFGVCGKVSIFNNYYISHNIRLRGWLFDCEPLTFLGHPMYKYCQLPAYFFVRPFAMLGC